MRSGGAARRSISRTAPTSAEKAKTKEDKTAALAECNAKFAGRRKPGGGYTYYDFMQDRTFDIAGPNPTPEEQKKIDEQYTAYLEQQRRNSIAAALTAKQQQQPQSQQGVQQVSLRSEPGSPRPNRKVPVPVASPVKQAARIRAANCAKNSFSCEWPRLSRKHQRSEEAVQLGTRAEPSRRRAEMLLSSRRMLRNPVTAGFSCLAMTSAAPPHRRITRYGSPRVRRNDIDQCAVRLLATTRRGRSDDRRDRCCSSLRGARCSCSRAS